MLEHALYWLLSALSLFFRCLPRRLAHIAGAFLGWIWYYLVPIRRQVALTNLHQAMPGLSVEQRRRIARGCLVNLARCAVEFLRLSGLSQAKAENLVEYIGWEHIQRAAALGRGVIVVTAHFGNFDLAACVAALRGLPLHVVTREQHLRGFHRYWMSVRARFGLGFVSVKETALTIHRILKSRQMVAMVIDQHMPPGRGMAVPFFGRLASTTHAPALMSYLTGAPIVPVTTERLPAGRHRVVLEPAVELDRAANREIEVRRMTEWFNTWLEGKIEKRPDHWLWIHRRWKLHKDS